MSISAVKIEIPYAVDVHITEDTLSVDFSDGRSISVPLGWYPRLEHASPEERKNWRLIGNGLGIHWEDIDEDISVKGLLAGKPSGENFPSKDGFKLGRLASPEGNKDVNGLKLSSGSSEVFCRYRFSQKPRSGTGGTLPSVQLTMVFQNKSC